MPPKPKAFELLLVAQAKSLPEGFVFITKRGIPACEGVKPNKESTKLGIFPIKPPTKGLLKVLRITVWVCPDYSSFFWFLLKTTIVWHKK